MTQIPESSNDRLEQLETTLNRFAELSFQSYRRHDDALSRLETNVARHDEALSRLEATTERNAQEIFELKGVITNLTTQQQRTDRALEALTTSVTDLVRTVAEEAIQANRDRAAWQAEIQRIWQYLESQTGNGNGRSEGNGG